MPRQIVLLRGVNLRARSRIAMPELREALTDAGFDDVKTYVQSGNVVLSSTASPELVARECARVIEDRFRFDIGVVVGTRAEFAKVVKRTPSRRSPPIRSATRSRSSRRSLTPRS